MKKFIYYENDGNLVIITPLGKAASEKIMGPMTDAEYEAHVLKRSLPPGITEFRFIEDNEIPTDRTFRAAWKDTGKRIKEDVSKVRVMIREMRDASLEIMDSKAWKESRKPNGNLKAINARAQELRDIPQDPNFASKNLTKLKALYEKAKESQS